MSLKHLLIVGIGHSGSTVLNIALTALPGAIALGEVENTFRKPGSLERDCTCGRPAPECEVWGPVLGGGEGRGAPESAGELYGRLYRSLADGSILIDSSKGLRGLRSLPGKADVELKVVFLLKDVRNHLVSYCAKERRRLRPPATLLFPLHLSAGLFWWWAGNLRIYRGLRRSGVPFCTLGYEELVLDTEKASRKLSAYLGEELDLSTLKPNEGAMHLLRGNRLKKNAAALTRLRYDSRWMQSAWIALLTPLLLPLIVWSRRLVYGPPVEKGR